MIPLTLTVTITGIGILSAGLFWFMPHLTRHDLYFAVTVAAGFRDGPEGKFILRGYRTELMLVSALALTAVVAGVYRLSVGFVPGGFLIQLAGSFIAFYRARQRVLPHALSPTTIREADLRASNRIVPGGWVVASGPFILLFAFAAYLWIHGASRLPNGWAAPTFATIYFLSTAGILAALTLMLYGTSHWVRSVHASGPEGARELKFRRTVSAILLVVEYFITLQSSWIALVPLRHHLKAHTPREIDIGMLPLFPVLGVVAIVVLARLGQGGSRMPATKETLSIIAAVPVGDRTPDSYWKLGIFYFNRGDSALLVEKRFGLGYTLNFARPTSWMIVLLVLVGPLVQIIASRLHR